jgi:O-methyltransferase
MFERVFQMIKHHTLCSRDRSYILWTTLRQALLLEGDVFESGVYRGGTALLAASTMAGFSPPLHKDLHSFRELRRHPETVEDVDRLRPGDFNTTSEARVAALLKDFRFAHIHAGFIPETFAGLTLNKICWAHIDVDIYPSVRDCISYVYPKLVPGGFMVFDDYGFPSCPGARRAVDETFEDLPEVPICLPTGQCLIVKLEASYRNRG